MAARPRHPPTARRRPRSARRRSRARRSEPRRRAVHARRAGRARAPRSTRSSALLTDRIDAEVLDAGAAAGGCASSRTSPSATTTSTCAAATAHGIAVCNTPGVLDETTADLAFLLILAASRLASRSRADLRTERWHGLGDHAVPRPRRARRHARHRRLRPHRPGGRAGAPRLRHAGAAPRRARHRRSPATSPISTSCSREADIVWLHVPRRRRDAPPDRRPPARAR